ncbi:caspase family protein [Chitinophaga sp. Mgbs1]|uniref:Caspase family protein n=1 Tax=Chitinophaga solisilvae TaxID=1233460 RepID=A0A3S1BP93_9BACT|nr:caspase family protein [Chitinophaga solisilvae]
MLSLKTIILLIGTGKYSAGSGFECIPNITVNLQELKQLFTDESLGYHACNTTIIELPDKTSREIMMEIYNVCEEDLAAGRLIIYYAGHGALNHRNPEQVYLTGTDSCAHNIMVTGINGLVIKNIIRESNASQKIFIVDSCYSGQLIRHMSAGIPANPGSYFSDMKGSYILSAAKNYTPASFDVDNAHVPTHFTAGLLHVIHTGCDNGAEYLNMEMVFTLVKEELTRLKRPVPDKLSQGDASQFIIALNRQYQAIDPVFENEIRKGFLESAAVNNFKGIIYAGLIFIFCIFLNNMVNFYMRNSSQEKRNQSYYVITSPTQSVEKPLLDVFYNPELPPVRVRKSEELLNETFLLLEAVSTVGQGVERGEEDSLGQSRFLDAISTCAHHYLRKRDTATALKYLRMVTHPEIPADSIWAAGIRRHPCMQELFAQESGLHRADTASGLLTAQQDAAP